MFEKLKSISPLFGKKKVEEKSSVWLAGIMAAAFLIAVVIFLEHEEATTFVTNNGTWNVASNLMSGNGYSACDSNYFPFCSPSNQVTAMREPIPVLLMAASRFFYPDEDAGLVAQSMLYLGTILAIYWVLKKEDIRTALIASFFWAVSIPVILEMGDDTGNLTAAFFFTIAMFYFLQSWKERKLTPLVLSGFFIGITALSRSVHFGIAIGLGLFLLGLQLMAKNRKQVIQAFIFLGVVCLTIAPWMIRNKIVFDAPVFGTTLTGYNLYRMNYYLGNEPFQPHYVGAVEGLQAVQKLIEGSALTGAENEIQMNDFYMEAGKAIILQYPFRYIGLSLYRFLILWFNIGFNKSYGMEFLARDYVAFIQSVFFLFAGIIGATKKYKEYWPLVLSIILGCGAYMVIGAAQMRYLVDFMPGIVILSAFAVSDLLPKD
ncbi:MAG: glycosyltransferase family 39 protein [Chloroflexi bacterium]|nr:glycosyltransferase family 39 protein [Chloroflexota bacterium]